ncbi:MAG: diguanylate cyclase [Candidatus Sumerlaeaceae bacterium]
MSHVPPRPGDLGSTAIAAKGRAAALGQQKLTPTLVCFEGAEKGKSFPINKSEMLIGRSVDIEIPITDELASRQHARIDYLNCENPFQEPVCYIEDMQSRNGTEVNGKRINSRMRLRTFDRVQIGTTVYGYMVKDDTEVQVQESYFALATQDALTGLNNRRQFLALAAHHIARAQRSGNSIALLVIDADYFKSINDEHGHDVGDQVLAHLAGIIRDACRAEEIAARWGGEEFVVLLPDCDFQGASTAAERIRSAVESSTFQGPRGTLHVTVSIGGAAMNYNTHFETLFHQADQQLLHAKRAGRNRVRLTTTTRGSSSISTAGY